MAKPIFIIALIEAIEKRISTNNRFFYETLVDLYKQIYHLYIGMNITPMHKPFYHLQNDGFWHIQYINSPICINSVKAINGHVEYAYLDNALWDLLQDKEARKTIKEEIVRFFKLDVNN
ncbi:hypothetical protein [Bacteroides caecimuris]|uniref:hypothetical protein n=1 Tax=Bacteroides caecimuris TaxID=1796613 RepID=UPI00272D9BA6|nr:hypothetical protein [Bacteroides caecimuris]